ncbi:alpha/beta fold hydrolase [Goodfellowiella coeruleoviolacea]|uniref:Alpha/beta hydrolase family n=1 Tax=Goodfellowiella coeruleoviolacea TaxID=334858 RepID=A0AAE3GAD0_9PSEU|nr:alpha/beta hydrolase [Goodfellowiella coeruleoviolacea]MCP2163647.1 Alpha/beta hydrolase family [Goodfellowiella coeruleoviolacea]
MSSNEVLLNVDQYGELVQLRVPALGIRGEAERSVPIEQTGRGTHALLPGSRFVVIEGAGRGIFTGDADRYNMQLLAFISKLPNGVAK